MPWSLNMANSCLDAYGSLKLFPRSGGWHEQDEFELDALRMAYRIQRFYGRKPKERRIEDESPDFFIWLEKDEYDVEYVSQLWMENS